MTCVIPPLTALLMACVLFTADVYSEDVSSQHTYEVFEPGTYISTTDTVLERHNLGGCYGRIRNGPFSQNNGTEFVYYVRMIVCVQPKRPIPGSSNKMIRHENLESVKNKVFIHGEIHALGIPRQLHVLSALAPKDIILLELPDSTVVNQASSFNYRTNNDNDQDRLQEKGNAGINTCDDEELQLGVDSSNSDTNDDSQGNATESQMCDGISDPDLIMTRRRLFGFEDELLFDLFSFTYATYTLLLESDAAYTSFDNWVVQLLTILASMPEKTFNKTMDLMDNGDYLQIVTELNGHGGYSSTDITSELIDTFSNQTKSVYPV